MVRQAHHERAARPGLTQRWGWWIPAFGGMTQRAGASMLEVKGFQAAAGCWSTHGVPRCGTALSCNSSLRMTATSATLPSLPRSRPPSRHCSASRFSSSSSQAIWRLVESRTLLLRPLSRRLDSHTRSSTNYRRRPSNPCNSAPSGSGSEVSDRAETSALTLDRDKTY